MSKTSKITLLTPSMYPRKVLVCLPKEVGHREPVEAYTMLKDIRNTKTRAGEEVEQVTAPKLT